MDTEELTEDLVTDLVRSCWIVESARERLYEGWAEADAGYSDDSEMARERAGLIEKALTQRGKQPDSGLVEAHAEWMRTVAGEHPEEVPLATFFIDRLGLWVDSHLPAYVDDGDALVSLGEKARAKLKLPIESL